MKKILIILSIFSGLVFTACEEDITLDIPAYEPKLAVYCVLYPDSTPVLFLSRSKGYFDYSDTSHEVIYIDNATVVIEDVDNKDADTLKATFGEVIVEGRMDMLNHYKGSKIIKQGGNYRLTVKHNNKMLTAETKVPQKVNLDASQVEFEMDTADNSSYNFTFKVNDPATEENAYQVFADSYPWVTMGLNNYYAQFDNDRGQNGEEIELERDYYIYTTQWPDTFSVFFRLANYNRSAAEYIESVNEQQMADDNPFVEPVIIKNNITGGLGVFGAATISDRVRIKVR